MGSLRLHRQLSGDSVVRVIQRGEDGADPPRRMRSARQCSPTPSTSWTAGCVSSATLAQVPAGRPNFPSGVEVPTFHLVWRAQPSIWCGGPNLTSGVEGSTFHLVWRAQPCICCGGPGLASGVEGPTLCLVWRARPCIWCGGPSLASATFEPRCLGTWLARLESAVLRKGSIRHPVTALPGT